MLDALLGDQAQEGRLLELGGKSLAEGVVKNGIAGFVGEVGENDGVRLGQAVSAAGIVEPASNSQESNEERSSRRLLFSSRSCAREDAWREWRLQRVWPLRLTQWRT